MSYKLPKPLVIIVSIAGVFTAVAGGIAAWDNIDRFITAFIGGRAAEFKKNNASGFRTDIVEEGERRGYDIKRDELKDLWWDNHEITNDSIEVFRKAFIPMLIDEKIWRPIGVQKNIKTGDLRYVHTNMKYYKPYLDSAGMYRFLNEQGRWEWCK